MQISLKLLLYKYIALVISSIPQAIITHNFIFKRMYLKYILLKIKSKSVKPRYEYD